MTLEEKFKKFNDAVLVSRFKLEKMFERKLTKPESLVFKCGFSEGRIWQKNTGLFMELDETNKKEEKKP